MNLKLSHLEFNPVQLIGSLTDDGVCHYLDPIESNWRFELRYSDAIHFSFRNANESIVSYPSFSMLYDDFSFFIRCKHQRSNVKCALIFFLSESKHSCLLILKDIKASEGIEFTISQLPIQASIADTINIAIDLNPDLSGMYNGLEISV